MHPRNTAILRNASTSMPAWAAGPPSAPSWTWMGTEVVATFNADDARAPSRDRVGIGPPRSLDPLDEALESQEAKVVALVAAAVVGVSIARPSAQPGVFGDLQLKGRSGRTVARQSATVRGRARSSARGRSRAQAGRISSFAFRADGADDQDSNRGFEIGSETLVVTVSAPGSGSTPVSFHVPVTSPRFRGRFRRRRTTPPSHSSPGT